MSSPQLILHVFLLTCCLIHEHDEHHHPQRPHHHPDDQQCPINGTSIISVIMLQVTKLGLKNERVWVLCKRRICCSLSGTHVCICRDPFCVAHTRAHIHPRPQMHTRTRAHTHTHTHACAQAPAHTHEPAPAPRASAYSRAYAHTHTHKPLVLCPGILRKPYPVACKCSFDVLGCRPHLVEHVRPRVPHLLGGREAALL